MIYFFMKLEINNVFITSNFISFFQNVKAYLRRGTARESVHRYKAALKGGYPSILHEFIIHTQIAQAHSF